MFINRVEELEALNERHAAGKAEFFVIYGRRRIGKTELITEFMRNRPGLYYEATSGSAADHLADISALLAEITGDALLREQQLTSWPAVFAMVSELAKKGAFIFALDEFQFIAHQSPDIGSQINRFWRTEWRKLPLFLILSGSDRSFFERKVMGYSATTYGRRTGSLKITAMEPSVLPEFCPRYSPTDLVRTWSVFGGLPYYLAALEPERSLRENIRRLVLNRGAMLREEPAFLLAQQTGLREDANYFSALRAVAAGKTRQNEIADRTGMSPSQTGQILRKLLELELVHKINPVTVMHPERSKTVRYGIADPFLNFWFRFVLPFQGLLHNAEQISSHLSQYIAPQLDEFASKPAFEEICQYWLSAELNAAAVGWWWGKLREKTDEGIRLVDREVDVICVDHRRRPIALGTCKWSAGKMSDAARKQLELVATQLRETERIPLYFFSRSGFSTALIQRAVGDPERYRLVETEELFKG